MKRIFLVDDHPMLREGMLRLIEQQPDWQVCGEARTSSEALDAIPKLAPDLVMMDISMPDKSGLELIKDLQAVVPGLRVLVFSMHDEMLYAERVIRAGAKGYIMKGAPTDKLTTAMECVLAGGLYLSSRVSNHILKSLSGKRLTGEVGQVGIERLTDRELEIFELIGRGKTNAQIADQLNISSRTVDAHRCNMRTKLALRDAPTLMREAVLWVELADRPS
jgi:DNA-binding NarL/FixJ family response regulator